MPLHLSSKLSVAIMTLMLAGCARAAPDLPKSMHSNDDAKQNAIEQLGATERKMSCEEIDLELAAIRGETEEIEKTVQERRGDNQAAVYFGGFFFPAYLAADDNAEEMKALDENQKRKDRFIALKSAKRCPSNLTDG